MGSTNGNGPRRVHARNREPHARPGNGRKHGRPHAADDSAFDEVPIVQEPVAMAKRSRAPHIHPYSRVSRLKVDEDFIRGARDSRFELLTKSTTLPGELYNLLIPQSIQGHAQQGHVGFRKIGTYPNATIEDVLEGLGISFKGFWEARQRYIDDLRVWFDRAVRDPADPRVRRPVNVNGRYLAGCSLISEFANAQAVIDALAGFVYASRMDTYDPWRARVHALFKVDLGGGKTVAVDMDRLGAAGLTLVDLSSQEHDADAMRDLVARGIVFDKPVVTSRAVTNGYVRQRLGLGVSDDAALITAGVFRGLPGYVGANWGDFIDTIDKSSAEILPGGQDEAFGEFVARECARNGIDLRLDDLTTVTWIALAAIDPQQPTQWVHCSQRYFHETERGQRNAVRKQHSPLYLHARFAQGVRGANSFTQAREGVSGIPCVRTGYVPKNTNPTTNHALYRAYLDRLEDFQAQGHIKVY